MTNLKVLVVVVSNYYLEGVDNLPFCKNDIIAMENALCNGLRLDIKDIKSCGKSGDVSIEEFKNVLLESTSSINKEDNRIFCFSGNGVTIDDNHEQVKKKYKRPKWVLNLEFFFI